MKIALNSIFPLLRNFETQQFKLPKDQCFWINAVKILEKLQISITLFGQTVFSL